MLIKVGSLYTGQLLHVHTRVVGGASAGPQPLGAVLPHAPHAEGAVSAQVRPRQQDPRRVREGHTLSLLPPGLAHTASRVFCLLS